MIIIYLLFVHVIIMLNIMPITTTIMYYKQQPCEYLLNHVSWCLTSQTYNYSVFICFVDGSHCTCQMTIVSVTFIVVFIMAWFTLLT